MPQEENVAAMRPEEQIVRIYRDGDKICALIGENLQEGTAGFGETEADALRELADAMES